MNANQAPVPNYALRQAVAATLFVLFIGFAGLPLFRLAVSIVCYMVIFMHGGMSELGWVE